MVSQLPFNRTLVEQFSIAYDMYLEIQYAVEQLANTALGRNVPNWRALNACAPCLYVLTGEAELTPKMLVTMDGNQSLKLVDHKYRAGIEHDDLRQARSDMWITPDRVDEFKDEVQVQSSTTS